MNKLSIFLLIITAIFLISCRGKDEINQVVIINDCWSSDGLIKWARIVTWPDIDGGMPAETIEGACKLIREAKDKE